MAPPCPALHLPFLGHTFPLNTGLLWLRSSSFAGYPPSELAPTPQDSVITPWTYSRTTAPFMASPICPVGSHFCVLWLTLTEVDKTELIICLKTAPQQPFRILVSGRFHVSASSQGLPLFLLCLLGFVMTCDSSCTVLIFIPSYLFLLLLCLDCESLNCKPIFQKVFFLSPSLPPSFSSFPPSLLCKHR